jgi:3-hydroxymyristoyl/3-hydroxydecanoyl-(acyl carrier protein) dehydratase
MELPHRFPFLLVDRAGEGVVRLELTAGSFWARGAVALPAAFCAEAVAQAAAVLLVEPGGARRQRWLAGIDRVELLRPLRAGESLEVRVRPEARFGGIVKVAGEIFSRSEKVAEAMLLLA